MLDKLYENKDLFSYMISKISPLESLYPQNFLKDLYGSRGKQRSLKK